MHRSRENFEGYAGAHETEEKLQFIRSIKEVLRHPDRTERYEVVRPWDSVRHLSVAIGKMGLTLNNTPFGEPRFDVTAKLFNPYRQIKRKDGKVVSMSVIAFDAYERKGTGRRCYSEYYNSYSREKYLIDSVIILKADEGLADKSELTAQDIEWDENCYCGGVYVGELSDITWFSISHKGIRKPPVFFNFERIEPNSKQAAALDAELAMFLQSREDKVRERRRIPWLGFAGIE